MFEIGVQLRRERGAENVFDFSIGNPDVEPPDAVIAALRRIVAENRPRSSQLHAERRLPGGSRHHGRAASPSAPASRSPATTS